MWAEDRKDLTIQTKSSCVYVIKSSRVYEEKTQWMAYRHKAVRGFLTDLICYQLVLPLCVVCLSVKF
jgi:hypothetical protein